MWEKHTECGRWCWQAEALASKLPTHVLRVGLGKGACPPALCRIELTLM